ncbi:hypothetical protein [Novosphingobium sp. UBA1939]|uniref:hypothetical protein n=1 Tax=Novosphingobium sp. UBA1939 TaxID=1946982 RepID=UPI0025FAEB9D|nr:hypothetical protein [Novosphingobium sp. UBA1939]
MGINIIIERPEDYERHSDWNSTRYAGDRDFFKHFGDLLTEERLPDGFPYEDDRIWYRPADFDAFRTRATSAEWPERWLKAADILEGNPDFWFYLSY